jgi:hypothetical protein
VVVFDEGNRTSSFASFRPVATLKNYCCPLWLKITLNKYDSSIYLWIVLIEEVFTQGEDVVAGIGA